MTPAVQTFQAICPGLFKFCSGKHNQPIDLCAMRHATLTNRAKSRIHPKTHKRTSACASVQAADESRGDSDADARGAEHAAPALTEVLEITEGQGRDAHLAEEVEWLATLMGTQTTDHSSVQSDGQQRGISEENEGLEVADSVQHCGRDKTVPSQHYDAEPPDKARTNGQKGRAPSTALQVSGSGEQRMGRRDTSPGCSTSANPRQQRVAHRSEESGKRNDGSHQCGCVADGRE